MNRTLLLLLASALPACSLCDWDDDGHDWDHDASECPDEPGYGYGQIDACEGAPQVQFPAAICVCDSLTMLGNFEARGVGGAASATVGVNGRASFLSNTEIQGTLHAQAGLEAGGNGEIRGDVVSHGDISWSGNLEIGGDVNVGGDLVGLGNLEIDGDLRLGGRDRSLGNVEIRGYGPYVSPAEPPCPCDPSTFFDVGAAVAAAASDPAIAMMSTALEGNAELRLTSGSYYVRDATWMGNVEVVIDGHVDLFIDDSITTLGNGELELTAGSTLDVYVAGMLHTLGNTWVGGAVPGAVRIYVGGDDGVQLSAGNNEFITSIYAPAAEVVYQGNSEILGAIFARRLTVEGNFEIAYPGLLDAPGPHRCPPPDDGEGDEPGTEEPATSGDDPSGDDPSDDDGPTRDTDPEPGDSGGDGAPGTTTGDDDPGTTTGDDPGTTGGDDDPGTTTGGDEPCPEIPDDCYAIEDKFSCMETTGCMWKHGSEYCTWQTCGGLDQTLCGLDQVCEWNECNKACYPS